MLKNPIEPTKQAARAFSGIGAVLMADSHDVAKLSARVSPVKLVDSLNRVTTAVISAVAKNEGIAYVHIGGILIAYWPPAKMPGTARSAICAASEAVTVCGASIVVSVAIAEFALVDVGPASANRSLLVGAAYQRAEKALRVSLAGALTVDSETLDVLPADIQARFVRKESYAELR